MSEMRQSTINKIEEVYVCIKDLESRHIRTNRESIAKVTGFSKKRLEHYLCFLRDAGRIRLINEAREWGIVEV